MREIKRISIVTICYNQNIFLKQAIESVLNQNYENLEYILVDPGSTDGSRDIINEYNIHSLYHFTDKENLNSIKENGGLFSWKYMIEKGIDIPSPGGDRLSRNLDSNKHIENYVKLSFNPNLMFHRF